MPDVLVTGATGFVGRYLAAHLRDRGDRVAGLSAHGGPVDGLASGEARAVDIADRDAVAAAVADTRPDEIYHLAAIARPTAGDTGPLYAANLMGTLHVLDAAAAAGAAVLVVSSAYVYAPAPEPIREDAPLAPVSDYGASKAAAELASRPYAARGVHVVRVRPFNHTGPGQAAEYLLPGLVRQVARIRAGAAPVVELGNLDAVRDFSDVRDVVRAYPAALRAGEPGEVYNVASGRGVSVRGLVDLVAEQAGVDVEVRVDPARLRAAENPRLVGDPSRLARATGWAAERPLAATIRDMLEAEAAAEEEA